MNNITKKQLLSFLKDVDGTFPTPLSEKQDLGVLAEKFLNFATLCAVFDEGKIASLTAGYTENLTENMAYISVVATHPEHYGRGYAVKTVREFLNICKNKKISGVHLYTAADNKAAIKLYEKLGFARYVAENEPRPQDVHLIFRFTKEQSK